MEFIFGLLVGFVICIFLPKTFIRVRTYVLEVIKTAIGFCE